MPCVKKILLLLIFCGAAYGLYRFSHKQTAGFAVSKIRSEMVPEARWECAPLSVEAERDVRHALSQPYSYLGKGAQCYVFGSEDGLYVIKFFRISHLEASPWIKKFPLPSFLDAWRKEKIAYYNDKKERDFTSYKLAYEELKEETGLLYLHLNKSHHLKQKLRLIDKIGVVHELNLDEMEFILQKRAKPFYSAISEMIRQHETEKAKAALSELVQLFFKRRSLGLSDKDPDLKTNFGVIEDRPMQFDIGRFKKGVLSKKNEPFREELIRITDSFKHWLKKQEPSLASHLEEEIQKIPARSFPENETD